VKAVPLEPCAAGLTAPAWEAFAPTLDDGSGLNDNHLSFSGELWLADSSMSTMVACDPGVCCNRMTRRFVLGDSPKALVIEDWGCAGDASRQCCTVPGNGERVIVSGNLVNTSPLRSSNASDRWHLYRAAICLQAD
jgi:hypothetical protein